jgi:predicted metal-dependent hydrolase
MTDRIQLGDIAVDVVFKDIKHVHLSVYPPDGRVRLAAPAHMSLETLRVFAVSKLGWIRTQQKKLHVEYILVHELMHLLERHHNARFVELMDRHLPQWRQSRDLLNGLPLAHEEWHY